MDIDHLVHMANRIAEFFEAMPDEEEARSGVAQHLQHYWEPRMRAQLIQHNFASRGAGLHSLVVDALNALAVRAD